MLCICICVYMIYICMYMYIYIYIYILHTHIHIHIHKRGRAGRRLAWCRHPSDELCAGSVPISQMTAVQRLDRIYCNYEYYTAIIISYITITIIIIMSSKES